MKKRNIRRTWALIRAAAAVVVAVVLLAATGFAVTDLAAGPRFVFQSASLRDGDYVQLDVQYVMSVFAVERSDAGEAEAYYAAVPVGSQFVTVRFSQKQFDSVTAMDAATEDFLTGRQDTMSFHLITVGRVRPLGEDIAPYFRQWFDENEAWMTASGVIAQIDDPSRYLSGLVVEADRVGTMDYSWALGLSITAGVLLVYAVAELVMVLAEVYDQPVKAKRKPVPAKGEGKSDA